MSHAPRILVVEGDPSVAELLVHLFEVDDYEVFVAQDVDFALKLARFEKPRAVLVDFDLPHTAGRALLDSLRVDATLRDIPVIAISNGYDAATYDAAMLGANAIIAKPLCRESLLELLHRVHGYAGIPSDEPAIPPRSHRGACAL